MSLLPDTWRSHAAMNRIQSGLLLGAMAGIVALSALWEQGNEVNLIQEPWGID